MFDRLSENKWYAPLVREALARGHEVEAWVNHRDISKTTKWYEFPDPAQFPIFLEGKSPTFRIFKSPEELAKLGTESGARLVFSANPLFYPKPANQIRAHAVSCFYESLNAVKAADLNTFDYIFFNTAHWIEMGKTFYRLAGQMEAGGSLERELTAKWVSTGTPQFDHFAYCRPEEIRRRYGIPEGKKVVTAIAFEANTIYWAQGIFLEPRLWKRLWNWLILPFSHYGIYSKLGRAKIFYLLARSIPERFRYFWATLFSVSEIQMMRAVREFCDRNDAIFLLKARKKHPLSAHHREIPDIVVQEDVTYFPGTIFEILSVSDLMLTIYSTAATEAAAAGVPVVNLIPPFGISYSRDQLDLMYRDQVKEREAANAAVFYNPNSDNVFNAQGVTRSWDINEAARELPKMRLGDFSVDPQAYEKYLRHFINESEEPAYRRILDFLEAKVKA